MYDYNIFQAVQTTEQEIEDTIREFAHLFDWSRIGWAKQCFGEFLKTHPGDGWLDLEPDELAHLVDPTGEAFEIIDSFATLVAILMQNAND